MSNPVENEICPHCGAPAVDMTRQSDPGKRWLCIGAGAHEWNEGDEFPDPVEDEPRPTLIQRLLSKFSHPV